MVNEEGIKFDVSISGVLDKFDGEPLPENLVERVTIEDGQIVKVQKFINGEEVD